MRIKSFLDGAKMSVPVIFAFIPVAAAMDLMLEPGMLMAARSRVSSSAKVVYFRIVLTSIA